MELELDPPQRPEIVEALGELLDGAARPPDPWWQAGLADALEPFDLDLP